MKQSFDPEQLDLISTKDGSPTYYHPYFDEHYHSVHGARQESQHVFIEAGFKAAFSTSSSLRILEMGFGTGLNAWLTWQIAKLVEKRVEYVTLELYPLLQSQWEALSYTEADQKADFQRLHQVSWEERHQLDDWFTLKKVSIDFLAYQPLEEPFELIYFDAFAPSAQPELWTVEAMKRVFGWCKPGAVFVTYSAKGDVRRALLSAGFEVEKLPGPPGKREMLRARVPA